MNEKILNAGFPGVMVFLLLCAASCSFPPFDLTLSETLSAARSMNLEKEIVLYEGWILEYLREGAVFYDPDFPNPGEGFAGGLFLQDKAYSDWVETYQYLEFAGGYEIFLAVKYSKDPPAPEIEMVFQNNIHLSDGRELSFGMDTAVIFESPGGGTVGSVFIGNLKFAYEFGGMLVFTHVYRPEKKDGPIIVRIYSIPTPDFR